VILFTPHHVEKIKAGAKTQTRRAWKRPRAKVGAVHLVKTELFSKEHHCKIRILDVRRERLGDISEDDARAEGGYSISEYIQVWKSINGVFDPDQLVYVVVFEVVG
jgi:hypothetical protein